MKQHEFEMQHEVRWQRIESALDKPTLGDNGKFLAEAAIYCHLAALLRITSCCEGLRTGNVELFAIFRCCHGMRGLEVARQGLHALTTDHAKNPVFAERLLS